MAATMLRSEERIGLVVAIAAHAAVLALLVWRPSYAPVFQPPQRIEVTLSGDVGLTSTSPEPNADAAPDVAPEIGDGVPQEALEARPEPVATPSPQPVPRAVASPVPKPVSKPTATPSPTRSADASSTSQPAKKPGGTRIGKDFLEGVRGAQTNGTSRYPPASAIGPAVRSSLAGAISRQLKPHWLAPQGVDAEMLVTVLAWDLNPDGTLDGPPRVVGQDGITDANRAQARRHAEQAIRAVELAAPFDLPSEYYNAWKRVTSFRFDKRLSQ